MGKVKSNNQMGISRGFQANIITFVFIQIRNATLVVEEEIG